MDYFTSQKLHIGVLNNISNVHKNIYLSEYIFKDVKKILINKFMIFMLEF